MTNKNREKIFNLLKQNKALPVDALSADEKRGLYARIVDAGGSEGFGYDRFFRVGFSDWELCGIDAVKQEFIAEHLDELLTIDDVNVASIKHEGVRSEIVTTDGLFWALINRVKGLQQELIARLEPMGMCRSTVLVRFKADNWKPYERRGIISIVTDFCDGTQED